MAQQEGTDCWGLRRCPGLPEEFGHHWSVRATAVPNLTIPISISREVLQKRTQLSNVTVTRVVQLRKVNGTEMHKDVTLRSLQCFPPHFAIIRLYRTLFHHGKHSPWLRGDKEQRGPVLQNVSTLESSPSSQSQSVSPQGY